MTLPSNIRGGIRKVPDTMAIMSRGRMTMYLDTKTPRVLPDPIALATLGRMTSYEEGESYILRIKPSIEQLYAKSRIHQLKTITEIN